MRSTVAEAAFTVKISAIFLFACYFTETYYVNFQRPLVKCPAKYNYFEVQTKKIVFATGQKQFNRGDVFNAEPIRQLVIALCPHGQFTVWWADTPSEFEKHNLKTVRIRRNDAPFVESNKTPNTQVYYKTTQNLHFDQGGPLIRLEK